MLHLLVHICKVNEHFTLNVKRAFNGEMKSAKLGGDLCDTANNLCHNLDGPECLVKYML